MKKLGKLGIEPITNNSVDNNGKNTCYQRKKSRFPKSGLQSKREKRKIWSREILKKSMKPQLASLSAL